MTERSNALGVHESSCGCSRHVTKRAKRLLKDVFAVLHGVEKTFGVHLLRRCLVGQHAETAVSFLAVACAPIELAT
jgi:hypothetical protein